MGNVINLGGHQLRESQVFDGERFELPDLGLLVTPSFRIEPGDPVLVMGSCFAAEIHKALAKQGFEATDAGLGLQYNAPSMLQQWRWALGEPIEASSLIPVTDKRGAPRVADPCAYNRRTCPDAAEALRWRHEQASRLSAELLRARVVVMTFGLVEVWRDELANVFCNVTPPAEAIRAFPGRYRCVRLTHAQNLEAMCETFRLIRSANPAARVVATVSPVPLAATFTGADVLIANCYSKSTLRSALTEAIDIARSAMGMPIDYFPSYELVTLSDRSDAWRERNDEGDPDGRHVRPEFVQGVIMRAFLNAYVEGHPARRAPMPASA
ncbi:MAG: GSCFA domain-containing protein [Phycisphaeraceae bacterium]|nr:GSCFA domain-containing protein [Phycisphaeraceae bacterium]